VAYYGVTSDSVSFLVTNKKIRKSEQKKINTEIQKYRNTEENRKITNKTKRK